MRGDKGILYVAIGERMRPPLERSIESVRRHLELPICLVTDLDDAPPVERIERVKWAGRPGYNVKPVFIPRLPFHRMLFLDTDTVILRSDAAAPLELITMRYGYHAAAVHGVARRFHEVSPLACVPSFNSGVLFFRRSPLILRAMRLWRRYYPGRGNDEVHLTRALLNGRVPIYCLPHEWNYRGYDLDDAKSVRIVHRRGRTPEANVGETPARHFDH